MRYTEAPIRLDMQGEACANCALVIYLPRPDEDDPASLQAQRRDVFTVMDFRQLGMRPRFVHALAFPGMAHP